MADAVTRHDVVIPLQARNPVFVRLDELPDPEGNPQGRRTRLAPPSAYVVRLVQDAENLPLGADGNLSIEALNAWYAVGEAVLPDLEADAVRRLSPELLFEVVKLVQQPLRELERIAKNACAPLAEAPKGSNSPTPSPTRSRASRRPTASGSAT